MRYLRQPGVGAARWKLAPVPPGAAERLRAELGLAPVTARLLAGRDLREAAAAARFLDPSLDDLHDPFLMRGMRPAVDRIRGRR